MSTGRKLIALTYDKAVKAIKTASPGDTIVLKNGIWSDVRLDFTGKGTADRPITLMAETPGEVIVTGASTLSIAGEYLVVEGLYFKEGLQPGKDGGNTIIRFLPESRHCRLTRTAIVDYHAADREKKYFWVTIDGSHHRVDHCYFKGKDYAGQLLRSIKYSAYNRIDHNYFVDIPAYGINGLEIIQVMGIGSDGEFGSAGGEHVVIEHNLFERADGECEEIISLKSNHDVIRNNTFKESIGGVVVRSGHNTLVENNYFIGGNVAGTKGIRICGEDNVVMGNYLTGLQGFSLTIMAGEYIENDLTGQWQPVLREGTPLGRVPMYNPSKNNTVAGNIMIHNEGADLDIGIGYKSGWPARQRVLLPENNDISDNVIVKERGSVITVAQQDPSVMDVAFAPNRFENNLVCAQSDGKPLPEGMAYADITLEARADGLLQPVLRGGNGASMPPGGPLNETQVGPEWVVPKREAGEPLFQPRDQFRAVENVPWDAKLNVWVLCTGSSDMFVRNMRTKLDAARRDLCPIEKDGSVLLPIRAVAEKLGLPVADGGHEYVYGYKPVDINGAAFLPAQALADAFGKCLFRNERGLIVLAECDADMAVFKDKSVIDGACKLFQVVASRFEKYMTIPPEGRTHGHIAFNTLNEDSASYWSSYGDGEWIRYDLGGIHDVASVGIAFVKGEDAPYHFDIEVSINAVVWRKVFSGQSGRNWNELEMFAVGPVAARFVRVTGHMNAVSNANRYSRVQVFTVQGQRLM